MIIGAFFSETIEIKDDEITVIREATNSVFFENQKPFMLVRRICTLIFFWIKFDFFIYLVQVRRYTARLAQPQMKTPTEILNLHQIIAGMAISSILSI